MLIFDIGANEGLFTDKCLATYDNIKIIVIEANPKLCEKLKLKYNNNESIIVLNYLVSNEGNLFIDFYLSDADTISTASLDWINNSRFTNNYKWEKPIKVESASLDFLIKNFGNPDLIKIDVEGYELEVVKGLSSKEKEICFEWAEEQYDNINKTCEQLKKLGYLEFGFIFGDEYLKKPNNYSSWENSEFHRQIDPRKKDKWGMIWVK